jgi:hypothetical protein
MLGDMMQNAETFCGDKFSSTLRETGSSCFADAGDDDLLNTQILNTDH